jgi:hypothetical protein
LFLRLPEKKQTSVALALSSFSLPGLHHLATTSYYWGVHLGGTQMALRPAFPLQLQGIVASVPPSS